MLKEGYKKTEIGIIPEDWEVRRLEDIINEFIVPMRDKPKVFDGDIDWCRIEDIEGKYINGSKDGKLVSNETINKMNLKVFPENSLICSCSASLGVYAINTKPLITNQTFIGLVPSNLINVDYLYYYMHSATNRLKKLASGTTIPYISREKFEKFKVILPDIKEQEKIAEILSTVDSQIDDTDKLIEKSKELKKGLMQKLLTKGIGHTEFKKTEVGEIPVDWEVKRFEDITDILRCGVASTPTYVDEGVMFLSAQNVQDGCLSLHKYNCVSKEYHEKLTKNDKPKRGDILYSRVGANYGIAAVVDIDNEFSVYVSLTLIRMKVNHDSNFYKYLLNSSFCKKQADIGVFQGAGVPNLNVKIVENFKMVVPPIEEQKKIANILSSVDDEIKEYENKKQKLEELKKGLMQQLLTGKIRTRI